MLAEALRYRGRRVRLVDVREVRGNVRRVVDGECCEVKWDNGDVELVRYEHLQRAYEGRRSARTNDGRLKPGGPSPKQPRRARNRSGVR